MHFVGQLSGEEKLAAYVDADVVVGADTVLHPFVMLEGSTKVGSACEIHSGARLVNDEARDAPAEEDGLDDEVAADGSEVTFGGLKGILVDAQRRLVWMRRRS